MDKHIERSNHQKIVRSFAKRLKALGFEKYKSSFFRRKQQTFIQYVHIHKYRSAPSYRLHLGIKPNDDEDKNHYLNGLESTPYECKGSPNGKKYNFSFHKNAETIDRCVENLHQFTVEVCEKWFNDWNDPERLLKSPESPLNS